MCGYCQSAVVRRGEVLARIGTMAEVFDDHSPLQLMAAGRHVVGGETLAFTLVGRLQFQGSTGLWTEWHALLPDGTSASLYDYRTKKLAPACAKLIEAVRAAPTRQTKNPEHKKRLRRLIDTKLREATKDDCSIGILGRRS